MSSQSTSGKGRKITIMKDKPVAAPAGIVLKNAFLTGDSTKRPVDFSKGRLPLHFPFPTASPASAFRDAKYPLTSNDGPPIVQPIGSNETFEFFLKFGKSSYRRKPVSSYFKMFWTPAFAGVTTKVDFQRSRNVLSEQVGTIDRPRLCVLVAAYPETRSVSRGGALGTAPGSWGR